MKNRTRQVGHSLAEYGIIGALLVLIAIPALMSLGGAISGLYAPAGGGGAGGGMFALTGGLLAPQQRSGPSGPVAFQGYYDARTGQVTYKLPNSSGGGTETASVDGGTRKISARLEQLVDTWVDSEGKPMDDELGAQIRALASLGHQLSSLQDGIVNGGKTNHWPLYTQNKNYNQQYYKVMSLVDKRLASGQADKSYGEIKEIVDGYSGVISHMQYKYFVEPINSVTNTGVNKQREFIIGPPPVGLEYITRGEVPPVTDDSAGQIGKTGEAIPPNPNPSAG